MPLQRGEVLGYDFNRMVVDFTMLNQGKMVKCAISTAAMDDLEGKHDVKADQRIDQLCGCAMRSRSERRASSPNGRSRLKDPWCYEPTISLDSYLSHPERSKVSHAQRVSLRVNYVAVHRLLHRRQPGSISSVRPFA